MRRFTTLSVMALLGKALPSSCGKQEQPDMGARIAFSELKPENRLRHRRDYAESLANGRQASADGLPSIVARKQGQ
jgi:hypothetical protein